MAEQKDRVEINWVQVSGSALAAVTSAVLLSTVGVAGTIIGAAVGSVFATAGSAIYQHYLRVSRARVAAAQAAARERVSRARDAMHPTRGGHSDTRSLAVVDQELSAAQSDLDEAEARAGSASWRENLAGLAWKKIALLTASVFAVVMIVIVGFELVSGESVSTLTGGTDGGGHRTSLGFGHAATSDSTPTPTPTPTNAGSGAPAPTTTAPGAGDTGSTTTPSSEPTGNPGGGATGEPTGNPSSTPSTPESATPSPTASATTPTPSASSTPSGTPSASPSP